MSEVIPEEIDVIPEGYYVMANGCYARKKDDDKKEVSAKKKDDDLKEGDKTKKTEERPDIYSSRLITTLYALIPSIVCVYLYT